MQMEDSLTKCQICFEPVEPTDARVNCPSGHCVCRRDFNSYLTYNVFEQLYKIRESCGNIACPVPTCAKNYDPIEIISSIDPPGMIRYKVIAREICDSNDTCKTIRNDLLDLLTLKCSSCNFTIDPLPDACSAVMCLNCGGYYCNYCFKSFASELPERNRSDAHIHAATHHPNTEHRDAFLPPDIVKIGQLNFRKDQVTRFLESWLVRSDVDEKRNSIVATVLLACSKDLEDVGLDLIELWNLIHPKQSNTAMPATRAAQEVLPSPPVAVVIDPMTVLVNAIGTGNQTAAEQILNSWNDGQVLNPNYVDPAYGHPLTTTAILFGFKKVAITLIARGADPFARSTSGRSVLYIAIEKGQLDIVKAMVQYNPMMDFNSLCTSESCKYRPIHVAARYDSFKLISYFAKLGVDVNSAEGEFGYTPLGMAVALKHELSARELLEIGSDPRIFTAQQRNSFYIAAEFGQTDLLESMVTKFAYDVNSVVSSEGKTMLHVAAATGQTHIVSWLLQRGAYIDACEPSSGYSALSLALLEDHDATAMELILNGASPQVASKQGRYPIYIAAERGKSEIIRAMVKTNVINLNDAATLEQSHHPPLHIAILARQQHLIPLLVSLGADARAADIVTFRSPLMVAVMSNCEWSVIQLLKLGADVRHTCKLGRTAMYYAVEMGACNIVSVLIRVGGFDVNEPVTRERHKGGALHLAVLSSKIDVVLKLLELNGDPRALDAIGRSPLAIAQSLGNNEIADTLQSVC